MRTRKKGYAAHGGGDEVLVVCSRMGDGRLRFAVRVQAPAGVLMLIAGELARHALGRSTAHGDRTAPKGCAARKGYAVLEGGLAHLAAPRATPPARPAPVAWPAPSGRLH